MTSFSMGRFQRGVKLTLIKWLLCFISYFVIQQLCHTIWSKISIFFAYCKGNRIFL